MKTKIELFTKFHRLSTGEEGEKKIEITEHLEKSFHEFMLKKIHNIIEDDEEDFIGEFMEYSDYYFEDFDSVKDYCEFKITAKTDSEDKS